MTENTPEEIYAAVRKDLAASEDPVVARTARVMPREIRLIKSFGVCYIARHIKRSGYVLLEFARDTHTGINFLIGPFISLSNEQMERQGLQIVVNKLHNQLLLNRKDFHDGRELSKALVKLRRNHTLIDISLFEENSVEMMTMIPLHARGARHADEIRKVPLPRSNEEFLQLVGEGFEIAG